MVEINKEAIKYLEAQEQPPCKTMRRERCNYCSLTFDTAGNKFKHQRSFHGKMEGWLK